MSSEEIPKLSKNLYHGSQARIRKWLEPKPSRVLKGESAVFATPVYELALAFIPKWSDDDFELGFINDELVWAEKRRHAFRDLVKGRSGYVHTVSSSDFQSDACLGMPRHEFIHRDRVRILETEHVTDVYQALKRHAIVLTRYDDLDQRKRYGFVE